MVLKQILKKQDGSTGWIHPAVDRDLWWALGNSHEPSHSLKDSALLDYLSNYWLLRGPMLPEVNYLITLTLIIM
jgi:hypothetical protein